MRAEARFHLRAEAGGREAQALAEGDHGCLLGLVEVEAKEFFRGRHQEKSTVHCASS